MRETIAPSPPGIDARARMDFVRYANCWEDADILTEALRPREGTRMLSIASAGDNSFALAAEGATVVAADLNPAQIALTALKREAIRVLDHPALLAFLGMRPAPDRLDTYGRLRPRLEAAHQRYWDERSEDLAAGIANRGKFERYFALFRTRVLPMIHSAKAVRALVAAKPSDERRRFYDRTWNNWRWQLLFRLFFSRTAMGKLGRDPEFFRYVGGSVSARILARTEYALTTLSTHDNPYLRCILQGSFADCLPPYLQPERFPRLRAAMDRVTVYLGGVDAAARELGGGFDGFNLSDVFEYLDADTTSQLYGALLEHARPHARLAYWNMLVPRSRPDVFADRVRMLDAESARLFAKDRAFFYSRFLIDEVLPG